MLKTVLAVTAIGAATLMASAPAQARGGGVKVGTLTCHVGSGWGFVVGSSRPLACVFSPTRYRTERYIGSMSKFGMDIGYKRSGTLVWAVFNPTDRLGPGDLHGHYGGLTASATVGVGLGANALIGGSTHTVTLQPLSIEGNTGLNVAAGIGALDLRYASDSRRYVGPSPTRLHHHRRHCDCH
ncbi:DUF992 domain-containing protein [Caulobacter sp. S45]|uniref:DUF992 domain-containing protein n=1 Tax=Caulobacter sp. S45 TaxID=1641861 RepID=UPI00131C16E8|nr:DUF992 domain-containing protein [Caulobacter sp. S45]